MVEASGIPEKKKRDWVYSRLEDISAVGVGRIKENWNGRTWGE